MIRRLDEHPERYNAIKWVHFQNEEINRFGSFAVHMARRLPQVKKLELCPGRRWLYWKPGQLHAQVFLHVRIAFESVTTLWLSWVIFPSAMVFGRLLCALPHLISLTCYRVSFTKQGVVPVLSLLQLATVDLDDSPHVVDFLVETGAGAFLRHVTCNGDTKLCSPCCCLIALLPFHYG